MKKHSLIKFICLVLHLLMCSFIIGATPKGTILMFVSAEDVYYSEYIVMKRALEVSGYQVDVRSARGDSVSVYLTPYANIEAVANDNSAIGSSLYTYNQFLQQFQSLFDSSWNGLLNTIPAYVPVNGSIQNVVNMSAYKGLVVVGGTGAIAYRVDGNYSSQGFGARLIPADSVMAAALKLNALAVEALMQAKPVIAQCHASSLPVFWRVPGTSGPGVEFIGLSLLKGSFAAGFPEPQTADTLLAYDVTYRVNDRVTVANPSSFLQDNGSGDGKLITTRDWYPQTIAHAARTFLNIIETYPDIADLYQPKSVLILHGGIVDVFNCNAGNRNNDIPCNYQYLPGNNIPADYNDISSLLSANSPNDTFIFNVSQLNLTGSLPYNGAVKDSIKNYLKQFDAIVFYKHWSTGVSDQLQLALKEYADEGGGILALHHGLYNDSDWASTFNKNILVQQVFGAQSYWNGWSATAPTTYSLYHTDYGHFITTYGITPASSLQTPAAWLSNPNPAVSNLSFSYYQRFTVYDEIYNNMAFISGQTFGRNANEINVLLSNAAPGFSPASQCHTSGFIKRFNPSLDNSEGRVAYFQPGERKENLAALQPYHQLIRNAVFWVSGGYDSSNIQINPPPTVYYYDGSGDVFNTSNWGVNPNGTGTHPPHFTGNNQHFVITNTATHTITGSWTVSGVNSKVIVGTGANPGTNFRTGSTFLFSGVIDITAHSTFTIQSNSIFTLGVAAPGSTVVYGANANQTIQPGTYHHITLNGASTQRTKSAGGNIAVLGNLQVASLNILAMGSFRITELTGSISGSGNIYTADTSSFPIPSGKSWSTHISFTASANQTIPGGTYNNGLTLAGSGSKNLAQNITVNGNLNIGSGCILNAQIYSIEGNILNVTGSGLVQSSSVQASPFPTGLTWTTPAVFSSPSPQQIPSGNYLGGIQVNGNSVSLSGNVSVGGTLSISQGRRLVIGNYTLTITGVIDASGSGTITGSPLSRLVIENSASDAGTLLMTQDNNETRSLSSLTLSRNTGANALIIGNPLRIINSVTITDGTLNGNGNLIFTSVSSAHAAQLSPVLGTGAVSGDFQVERYVQATNPVSNSHWRFVASPVSTTNYIQNNWQQQVHITGNGSGGSVCPNLQYNSNGFDPTQVNNPSMFRWDDNNQQWQPMMNTNQTQLLAGVGYRLFVRGNRGQGCDLLGSNRPTPQPVVLNARGGLTTGDITLFTSVDPNGWSLIGNPYQATIDWESPAIIKENITGAIYGFNPITGVYGVYHNGVGVNSMSRYIAPGTAFWVRTDNNGNGSISFTEASKVVDSIGFSFFKKSQIHDLLRIKLVSVSTVGNTWMDEAVLVRNQGSSWVYKVSEDALKLGFSGGQLALGIPGQHDEKYAICFVPGFDQINNRINVETKLHTGNKYQLAFERNGLFNQSINAYLYDHYRGVITDINANPIYQFSTPDSLSVSSDRFYLVLQERNQQSTLPVVLSTFNGTKKQSGENNLFWTTVSELNFSHFVVERKDATSGFEEIGTVHALQGEGNRVKNYTFMDSRQRSGRPSYYRLKMIDLDHSVQYSPVLFIDQHHQSQEPFIVYPVPARSEMDLVLSVNRPLDQIQSVRLIDTKGTTWDMHINRRDGNINVWIGTFSSGIYTIEMALTNGEVMRQKITVNNE